MAIDPVVNGGQLPANGATPSRTGAAQVTGTGAADARVPARDSHQPPIDRVDLSEAAKALADREEARPSGSLSPERLRDVVTRLASGFYDRPEVRAEIARRALRDPTA